MWALFVINFIGPFSLNSDLGSEPPYCQLNISQYSTEGYGLNLMNYIAEHSDY